jgi:glycine cleavage system regulatory protein
MCDALGIEGAVVRGNHTWLLADPDAFDEVLANVVAPVPDLDVPPRVALRALLDETTMPPDVADRLVVGAPDVWLASEAAADLAADLSLTQPALGPGEVRARAAETETGTWRLTVAAHDRAGLLADTAGVLSAERLSISSASVATWTDPDLAVHALTVEGPSPGHDVLERLGRRLQFVGSEPLVVDFAPAGRATVTRAGEANGDPILTVSALDQPGLLFSICRWLADNGGSIQAAGIGEGAGEVTGVFIVRDCPDPAALERHISRPQLWWMDGPWCRNPVARLLRPTLGKLVRREI